MGQWSLLCLLMLQICVTSLQSHKGIECKAEGYFRHPDDCRRFYRCTKFNRAWKSFVIFHFICPKRTAFDDILDVCVWPRGVRPPCKEGTFVIPDIEDTGGTRGKEVPPFEPESSFVVTRAPLFPPLEETIPFINRLDSTKSPHVKASPENSHTTPPRAGSSAGAQKCHEYIPPSKSSSQPSYFTNLYKDGSEYKVPFERGKSIELTDGAETNSQHGEESIRKTVTWNNADVASIECEEEGYFRNPDDCRRFYVCTTFNGTRKYLTAFHFICPEHTAFDDILDVCVWPLDARPPCREKDSNKDAVIGTKIYR